jgi:starch phosphorylase
VTTKVTLGELRPEEVDVELYYKNLKTGDPLAASNTRQMTMEEDLGNGEYLYACDLTCNHSGRFGFTARVTPRGDDRIKFAPGLLTWA